MYSKQSAKHGRPRVGRRTLRRSLSSAKRHRLEWGLRIKCRVDRKFYRAAAAFRAVAHRSKRRRHAGVITIIVVPEVKRLEVMHNEGACYFVRGCPEIGDPEIRLEGGKEVL
jgi:hypothetical protein